MESYYREDFNRGLNELNEIIFKTFKYVFF